MSGVFAMQASRGALAITQAGREACRMPSCHAHATELTRELDDPHAALALDQM